MGSESKKENGSIEPKSNREKEIKPKGDASPPPSETAEINLKKELIEHKKEIEATSDREIKGVIELLPCMSEQETDREETPSLDVSLAKTEKIIEEMRVAERPSIGRTHRLLLVSNGRLSYLNVNIEALKEQSSITWNQLSRLKAKITEKERKLEHLNRGVFRKLRSLVERRRLNSELQAANQQQEKVGKSLSALREEINKAREKAEELERLREKTFLGTVERVALGVRERHLSFTSELMEDSEELTERMNEELVRRKYLPELTKSGAEGEIIQKCEEIVLAQLNEKSSQEEEDNKQLWDRAIRGEEEFAKLGKRMIGYLYFPTELGVGSESVRKELPNKGYERIFDLLSRTEATAYLKELSSAIESSSLSESLEERALQSVSRVITPVDYRERPYHVDQELIENYPENMPLEVETMDGEQLGLMLRLAGQRWGIVRGDPTVNNLFRNETWIRLEEDMARTTLESLLVSESQTNRSINLGFRLFWLAEQNSELKMELAPYIILNSWREAGYSGEWPFLREDLERKSMLLDFVKSFSDEQLEELEQRGMPGLLDIIQLVRENPDTFNEQKIENPEWTKIKQSYETDFKISYKRSRDSAITERDREKLNSRLRKTAKGLGISPSFIEDYDRYRIVNPAYHEIQKNLIKIGLALLEGEEKNKQIFALELLSNLSNLGKGYEILNKIFMETGEERLRRGVLKIWPGKEKLFINDALSQPSFEKSVFVFLNLRNLDPYLREVPEAQRLQTDEAILHRFHEAIEKVSLRGDRVFFSNKTILHFLARQPERIDEVLSLFDENKQLFKLLGPGGPLHANRNLVVDDIFSNGDISRRAAEIESIFSKKFPFWKQLYLFTSLRLGDRLAAAASGYPLVEISGVPLKNLVRRHQKIKSRDENERTRLETIIKNDKVVDRLVKGEIDSVFFEELTGGYKRLVFRDFLRKSIENSRSEEFKRKADKRNRDLATDKLTVSSGIYIHGSPVDVIDSVLLNGNLPREALGEEAATDAFPFHTDFACLTDAFIKDKKSLEIIFDSSLSGKYGQEGSFKNKGQVFYVYRRGPDSYEQGKFHGISEDHALILGGMPATEISGVVLREPETTFEIVKRAILENGFYIPVYDFKGNLLLTSDNYDEIRDDSNLSVPVEVWDFSFKTGEQLGSNPGAEFTVPTDEGPKRFYTKFALGDGERINHIWCEQLADNIYRFMDIPVPNTRIVKVEGSYGHASELLPPTEGKERSFASLKKGFLVDALLANWDIPYAFERNTIEANGIDYRIDNGGALLFHATGDRKGSRSDDLPFGEEVLEIRLGSDRERLGLGMRQEYRGLTDEEVRKQATVLKEKLTDEAIDELVDSVRLSEKDRDYLKKVFRKRRDNVIKAVGI